MIGRFGGVALLLVTGATLAGCTEYVWRKSGASSREYSQTRYACERDSNYSVPVDNRITGRSRYSYYYTDVNQGARTDLFRRCMYANGWQLVAQDSRQAPVVVASPPPRPGPLAGQTIGQGANQAAGPLAGQTVAPQAVAPQAVAPQAVSPQAVSPGTASAAGIAAQFAGKASAQAAKVPGQPASSPKAIAAAPATSTPAAPLSPATPATCTAGARVFAWSDDAWWPATVRVAQGDGNCLVHYEATEQGSDEDEAVEIAALLPWRAEGPGVALEACTKDADVLALSDGGWYRAKIKETRSADRPCPVHYAGWNADQDEEIPLSRMRRM